MSVADFMKEEMDVLRAARDELRVQAELGKLELRDRWNALEKDWQKLEGRLKVIAQQGKEEAGDVREAAKLLAGEIREGYEHLKQQL